MSWMMVPILIMQNVLLWPPLRRRYHVFQISWTLRRRVLQADFLTLIFFRRSLSFYGTLQIIRVQVFFRRRQFIITRRPLPIMVIIGLDQAPLVLPKVGLGLNIASGEPRRVQSRVRFDPLNDVPGRQFIIT